MQRLCFVWAFKDHFCLPSEGVPECTVFGVLLNRCFGFTMHSMEACMSALLTQGERAALFDTMIPLAATQHSVGVACAEK